MSMIFGDSTKSVRISIIGYEFPHSNELYDANWLIVQAVHFNGGKRETLRDACLLTWELVKLRDCFSEKIFKELDLQFIEPEISFHFSKPSVGLVQLKYGLVPSWLKQEEPLADIKYDFHPCGSSNTYLLALENWCKMFPIRECNS